MKFLNDFKNIFAIVGVVSIIFWTCASDSTSDDNSSNLPPQLTGGTYQVESISGSTIQRIVVLNTETGVMKTYQNNDGQWGESPSGLFTPITFTH
tara:strand:- start:150 stop:434 length:285 start_codon:yes stop_codon:yes gene_type:complete